MARPVAVGAGLAACGGVCWALLATYADFHVGYVIWGMGVCVAAGMALATRLRGETIVYAAICLVVAGFLLGEVLGIWLQARPLSVQLAEDQEAVEWAALDELARGQEIDSETARIVMDGPDDTTTAEAFEKARQAEAKVRQKVSAMSLEEKRRVAEPLARKRLGEMSWGERIERQTSLFDAVWFVLAIGSVWFILRGNGTSSGLRG